MKKFIGFIICFIFCIFLASCSDGGSNNGERLLDSARNIKVVQIEGSATVTDDTETVDCFKGMNLYDGDTLNVGKDSVIVVKFDEDKYVYLGENSKVNIKSEGKDKFKTNVFVEMGVVLAEIQNKLGEDEEFFLSSNNSVMAVRGTIFGVTVRDDGSQYIETYAVYRGVTELVVFDKVNGQIIKGKLTDLSNKKIEIKVPKDHVIPNNDFKDILSNWLSDVNNEFDNPDDANDKLDEVQITVTKPTKDDFDQVVNIVETDVTYSDIEYTSKGFFGEYDGNAHKIEITPITNGATVKYSLDGINYQDDNTFEFYSPGQYRVYYRIQCEGYDTKEDFEVIYITNPTVKLESDHIYYDNNSKASILDISNLSDNDFNRFNGVKIDTILANREFYINNTLVDDTVNVTINYNKKTDGYIELVDGKNTLNVTFEFPTVTLNVDVNFLFSDTREDSGYAIAASNAGIEQLSNNVYYINDASSFVTSVGVGAYESEGSDLLSAFGLDVLDLTTMLINYPYDVKGNDTAEFDGRTTIELEDAAYGYVKLNFLVFPNATTKGFDETIYVTVKAEKPEEGEYATFSISKTSYAYNPAKNANGVKMNFVTSDYPVKYSIDGTNFVDELYVEAGTHKVYYKVIVNENNEAYNITNYEYIDVTAGEGVITFDNKMFVTNPVHILSNDNNEIYWKYDEAGASNFEGYVTSTNGGTITSLDDAYTVYTNLIKNSVFYDSISGETIDAVVTVSNKKANSANFNYTIEADGYETLSGTVRFENSELGTISDITVLDGSMDANFVNVTLPNDYEISLNDVPQAIPSRISCSLEDYFINYETYYSIDEGKTWTKKAPTLIRAGEYDVYVLYCFVDNGNDGTTLVDGSVSNVKHSSLAANGNFIIDIEHITITE